MKQVSQIKPRGERKARAPFPGDVCRFVLAAQATLVGCDVQI